MVFLLWLLQHFMAGHLLSSLIVTSFVLALWVDSRVDGAKRERLLGWEADAVVGVGAIH